MKTKKSIKRIIIKLFLLFAFIPIIFLSWTTYRYTSSLLRNQEINYAELSLHTIIQSLHSEIQQSKDTISGLCLKSREFYNSGIDHDTFYDEFMADQNINELLLSTSPYSTTGIMITFINTKNEVFTNGTSTNSATRLEDDFIQDIIENHNEYTVTRRSIYSKIETPVVTVGRALFYKQEFIGVIFADIYYSNFDRVIDKEELSEYNFYLFNEHDKLLYSFGSNIDTQIESYSSLMKKENLNEKTMSYLKFENTEWDWSALVIIPQKELYKNSNMLLFQSIISIIILTLESVILAWILGAAVSKDLVSLSRAVEKFSKDGKPIKMKMKSSDELVRLASGIEDMTQKISVLIDTVKAEEQEKHRLEVKMLMAQITPHMIYNTLNTITFLAQMQGVYNISEISDSFVKMIRLLTNIPGELLTVQQEVDYLKSYVNIKKYNLLIPIDLQIDIDEKVNGYKIPKLILQPFVENCLKHGFNGLIDTGVISIQIHEEQQKLSICIHDNGCGISKEKVESLLDPKDNSQKIGIYNTWKRLKLFYGDDFSLYFDSDGASFTTIHLNVPIHPKTID